MATNRKDKNVSLVSSVRNVSFDFEPDVFPSKLDNFIINNYKSKKGVINIQTPINITFNLQEIEYIDLLSLMNLNSFVFFILSKNKASNFKFVLPSRFVQIIIFKKWQYFETLAESLDLSDYRSLLVDSEIEKYNSRNLTFEENLTKLDKVITNLSSLTRYNLNKYLVNTDYFSTKLLNQKTKTKEEFDYDFLNLITNLLSNNKKFSKNKDYFSSDFENLFNQTTKLFFESNYRLFHTIDYCHRYKTKKSGADAKYTFAITFYSPDKQFDFSKYQEFSKKSKVNEKDIVIHLKETVLNQEEEQSSTTLKDNQISSYDFINFFYPKKDKNGKLSEVSLFFNKIIDIYNGEIIIRTSDKLIKYAQSREYNNEKQFNYYIHKKHIKDVDYTFVGTLFSIQIPLKS